MGAGATGVKPSSGLPPRSPVATTRGVASKGAGGGLGGYLGAGPMGAVKTLRSRTRGCSTALAPTALGMGVAIWPPDRGCSD